MLAEYVIRLQKDLDLKEPLASQGESLYALALEDNVISISDKPPGFELSCNLGVLPSQKQEEFFTMMLRGNLFGQATHLGVLGLDETGNKVLLNFTFAEKPSYKDFRNAIEDFLNVVDYWRGLIKDHPATL